MHCCRRWSDDCLESSHIPNEVYFGDVPVPLAVLYNYYDANAERERLAAHAAHLAAHKAAAAKLAAAHALHPHRPAEVTSHLAFTAHCRFYIFDNCKFVFSLSFNEVVMCTGDDGGLLLGRRLQRLLRQ